LPPKLEAWLAGLSREVDHLAARSDCKVLHPRSDQKVFCAGADLEEMKARFQGGPRLRPKLEQPDHSLRGSSEEQQAPSPLPVGGEVGAEGAG
jgi:enoyl-CoA hydratase/carnithine racemase